MAWLDLLIIVLIILNIIIGYKKGLVLTLFSIGSYIAAFILSKKYYGDLTLWIKTNFSIIDKLKEFLSHYVQLNLPSTVEGVNYTGANPDIFLENTEQVFSLMDQESLAKMPQFLQKYLINEIDVQTMAQQTIEGFRNQVIDTLATLLLNIISMIILFLVIRWTIVIIGMVVNKIFELPLLGAFNHTLGGILGVVRGLFIVVLILFILIPISMSWPEGFISLAIERSYLVQFFLNHVVIFFLRGLGAVISL